MEEELEELDDDTLPEGDEEIPEEAEEDVEDGGEEPPDDEAGEDDDSGESEALEPDGDVYAEVEYEKDGELYRYEVPKDVADAIRAAERERLGGRTRQEHTPPVVAKSELANVVATWLKHGHSDEQIIEAVAKFYYDEHNSKPAEEEETLPENASIEEEIEFRLAKAVKPLQKKIEQYETAQRQQVQEQKRQETWTRNDALFEAELEARGLPLEMNQRSKNVLRSVINEMYPVPLDEYQLKPRQVRAILDQFAKEMEQDDDGEEEQPTTQQYQRARVVYGGKRPAAQRQQTVKAQPKTPPQILSGRTVRNGSFRSQEPEKPKSPQDVNALLLSL